MLRHGGPDDEGYFLSGPIALGHRRRSIIDFETGRWPMDKMVRLVCNSGIDEYRGRQVSACSFSPPSLTVEHPAPGSQNDERAQIAMTANPFKKLSFKIREYLLLWRSNNTAWTLNFFRTEVFQKLRALAEAQVVSAEDRMLTIEREHGLEGTNGVAINVFRAADWNWWNPASSHEWEQAIVADFMEPYIAGANLVLEIGPGGGRWTKFLLTKCAKIVAVDIAERCLTDCKKKFGDTERIAFHLTDGKCLPMLSTDSVDGIWSYGTFVHINESSTKSYLREFVRILKIGGVAVIHHPKNSGLEGYGRSRMSSPLFVKLAREAGLEIVEQCERFRDGATIFEYPDVMTVMKKARQFEDGGELSQAHSLDCRSDFGARTGDV